MNSWSICFLQSHSPVLYLICLAIWDLDLLTTQPDDHDNTDVYDDNHENDNGGDESNQKHNIVNSVPPTNVQLWGWLWSWLRHDHDHNNNDDDDDDDDQPKNITL